MTDLAAQPSQPRQLGRSLPAPTKPKRQGYEPPPAVGAPPAAGARGSEPVVDLVEAEPVPAAVSAPVASPASTAGSRRAASTPTELGTGSTRVTVYSDARIEDYLHDVRVQATIARLDLTHSAVWRRAMYEYMQRRTPDQVVAEFTRAADGPSGRPGRPRR